jgi:hypothetical protein
MGSGAACDVKAHDVVMQVMVTRTSAQLWQLLLHLS